MDLMALDVVRPGGVTGERVRIKLEVLTKVLTEPTAAPGT